MQINLLSRIGFGSDLAWSRLGACPACPNRPCPVGPKANVISQISAQDGPGNHAGRREVERDHNEMEQGIGIHARSIGSLQFLLLEKDQKPFDF